MKTGLLSDTHGLIHPRFFDHFASCDEIWHAGDISNIAKNIHDMELIELGERGKSPVS